MNIEFGMDSHDISHKFLYMNMIEKNIVREVESLSSLKDFLDALNVRFIKLAQKNESA